MSSMSAHAACTTGCSPVSVSLWGAFQVREMYLWLHNVMFWSRECISSLLLVWWAVTQDECDSCTASTAEYALGSTSDNVQAVSECLCSSA
jgi:hypothetical protein